MKKKSFSNNFISVSAFLLAMLPLLVVLGAWFFLGETLTAKMIVGLVLAAAGAVWLSLGGTVSGHAPRPVLGNFLEFLAMISATGYIILLKKLSGTLPPLFLTAIMLGFIILGERLSGWQIAACLVVFTGVVISREHRDTTG